MKPSSKKPKKKEPLTADAAIRCWKKSVYDKSADVDSESEFEWFSMAYGFFMGLGFDPEPAFDLAMLAQSKNLI